MSQYEGHFVATSMRQCTAGKVNECSIFVCHFRTLYFEMRLLTPRLYPSVCLAQQTSCNASDPDAVQWKEEADSKLTQCLIDCDNDANCRSACNRDYTKDTNNCPCESGCSNGCPCENYECSSWRNPTSILGIFWDPFYPDIVPTVKIQTSDGTVLPSNVQVGQLAEVKESCSVVWKNQMLIFGGEARTKQIVQIIDCKLEIIGHS